LSQLLNRGYGEDCTRLVSGEPAGVHLPRCRAFSFVDNLEYDLLL
jgi:hypothetical protein